MKLIEIIAARAFDVVPYEETVRDKEGVESTITKYKRVPKDEQLAAFVVAAETMELTLLRAARQFTFYSDTHDKKAEGLNTLVEREQTLEKAAVNRACAAVCFNAADMVRTEVKEN